MNQSTKEQIITILKSRGPLTAAQLSAELHLTKANIRIHLQSLINQGLVFSPFRLHNGSNGRPPRLFSIVPPISRTLLPIIFKSLASGKTKPLIIAEEVVKTIEDKQSESSGSHLLTTIIKLLNKYSYAGDWQASPVGAKIRFKQCPYFQLLPENTWLCEFDCAILTKLTGLTITPVTIKASNPNKPCEFIGI